MENANFHRIMDLQLICPPMTRQHMCLGSWERCTYDVREILNCLTHPCPLSLSIKHSLSLWLTPSPGGRHMYMTPCLPQRRWTGRSSMAHKAKDRMEGEGTGRESRGRERPDRGIFHLKALLSYRSSIKTERRDL